MSKVVVIGARGFLGQAVCAQLCRCEIEVVGISSATGAFDAASGVFRPPEPDAGVTAVIYLSQSPYYREPFANAVHLWAVNVQSVLVAADWARKCGASRFIHASSGVVYQPGFAPHREDQPLRRDRGYALSKVHAEEVLAQFKGSLDVTCARFFTMYGPAQRGKLIPTLIDTVAARRPVLVQPHPLDPSDREGVRLSLVHVDDAARAVVDLLPSSGVGAINIASPETRSITQIATVIGNCLGEQPRFELLPHAREGEVVADTSLLSGRWPHTFVKLSAGIAQTIAAMSSER